MRFYVTNPGQSSSFEIDPIDWSLKQYKDLHRARQLNLTTERRVPIVQFAEIKAEENGKIWFRGYASDFSINKKSKQWTFKGNEQLLYHRWAGRMNHSFTDQILSDLISDIPPVLDTTVPALVWGANSAFPKSQAFTVYSGTYSIIKLAGWGTNSRLGSSPAIYIYDYQMTKRNNLTDLNTNDHSYYIDSTDLYITHQRSSYYAHWWPYTGDLYASNCFDTKVRVGTLENGSTAITADVMTDADRVGDQLVGLADAFDLNIRIRDDPDGYTYLDFTESDGDGATDGIYTLCEADLTDFEYSTPNEPRCHALTGRGLQLQHFSVADPTWKGVWIHDYQEYENGFRDTNGLLQSLVQADYDYRQQDFSWRIKTARPLILRPGDYIKLLLDGEPPQVLSSNMIEYRPNGLMTLELGQRTPDLVDAWNARGSIGKLLENSYLREFSPSLQGSCTFKPKDMTHSTCTAGSVALTVPSNVKSASYNSRILLDVSLSLDGLIPSSSRWTVYISIGSIGEWCIIDESYINGESMLSDIDVTDLVTAGASNTVSIQAILQGNFTNSHTSCTGHPDMDASVTMRFVKRQLF